jgi:hypothetical protein
MVATTDTATAIGRRDIAALLLGFTLAAAAPMTMRAAALSACLRSRVLSSFVP